MEYFTIFVCLTCVGSANLFKLDESQVNQWTAMFQKNLDAHIDKMLGYQQIKSMLQKYENDLVMVPIKGDQTFKQIIERVNSKYNDLVLAVNKLKSSLEKALTGQQSDEPEFPSWAEGTRGQQEDGPPALGNGHPDMPGPPAVGQGPAPPIQPGAGGPVPVPPIPEGPDSLLQRCCAPETGQKYDGRFREEVKMKACYENVDEALKNISKSDVENVFKVCNKKQMCINPLSAAYLNESSAHFAY